MANSNAVDLATEVRAVTPQVAPPAAPSKAAAPAAAAAQAAAPVAKPVEDTVTLSPAAKARVPIAAQVRNLNRQGESAVQIANKLGLSQQAVASYLGTVQATPKTK